MEELFQLVLLEMPQSDYASLAPAGIVLTGGASNLSGLDALAHSVTQLPVRLGRPTGIYGITDAIDDPAYATGVGLLLWGVRNQGQPARRHK